MHAHRFLSPCIAMGVLVMTLGSFGASGKTPQGALPHSPPLAEIRTSDVDLFYRIYDGAEGAPSADALQRYIDDGSDGVRQFIPHRIKSAEALAKTIAEIGCGAHLG